MTTIYFTSYTSRKYNLKKNLTLEFSKCRKDKGISPGINDILSTGVIPTGVMNRGSLFIAMGHFF